MEETADKSTFRKDSKRLREILSAFRKHKIIETIIFGKNLENLRLAFEDLGPTFI